MLVGMKVASLWIIKNYSVQERENSNVKTFDYESQWYKNFLSECSETKSDDFDEHLWVKFGNA